MSVAKDNYNDDESSARWYALFSWRQHFFSLIEHSPKRHVQLDAWRSLAMLLVYVFHCFFYARYALSTEDFQRFYLDTPAVLYWVWAGDRGVELFFVLSGFLIGRQLFRELEQYGRIHFSAFYMRRILRIMPVYVLAMMVFFALNGENKYQLWANLFFVNNFLDITQSAMGWCWSLAVEEQFYLLLPVLLMLVHRLKLHVFYVLLGLCIVAVAVRALVMWDSNIVIASSRDIMFDGATFNNFFNDLYNNFYTRFGELLIGVIVAYAVVFQGKRLRLLLRGGILTAVAATTVILLILYGGIQFDDGAFLYLERDVYRGVFLLTNRYLFSLAIAILIVSAYLSQTRPMCCEVRNKRTVWSKVRSLSAWLSHFYAKLSYSMYVFHPFVIFPMCQLIYPMLFDWGMANYSGVFLMISVSLVMSTVLSTVIYILWERPFTMLRDPLAKLGDRSSVLRIEAQ